MTLATCQPAEFTLDSATGLHWPQIVFNIDRYTERGPIKVLPSRIEQYALWAVAKMFMGRQSPERLFISIGPINNTYHWICVSVTVYALSGRALATFNSSASFALDLKRVMELLRS
jgi:hypothetical protein